MAEPALSLADPALTPEQQAEREENEWLDAWLDDVIQSDLWLPEEMTATQWSRVHYRLSAEVASAEGPWDPVSYQADMLDVFCMDAGPEEIFVRKSARIGYTATLLATVAYIMGYRRRHTTIYMPNDTDAKSFVKDSVDPLIRDCAPLAEMQAEILDKRSGDTVWLKMLGGKLLRIAGAVSPARFRRVTSDFVMLDELDGYPSEIGNEGDPVTLSARAIRNSPFRKLIAGSTPTEASTSMISREMGACSVVFEFAVECPSCGSWEIMRWKHMRWDEGGRSVAEIERRSRTVRYVPSCCGQEWDQTKLEGALEGGQWVAPNGDWILTSDGDPPKLMDSRWRPREWPRRIGFSIWAGYSLWYPWSSIVHDWLSSQGDVLKLKTFTNLTLGEVWLDEEIILNESDLMAKRESLDVLPPSLKALYASVDVQNGWLSCLLVGYGPGEESWIVERREFHGGNDKFDSPAWTDLYEWLRSNPTWEAVDANGEVVRKGIDGVVLDSGYHSEVVYRASFRIPHRRVAVIKGVGGWGAPLVKLPPSRAKTREGRTRPLFLMGSDQAKMIVAHRLPERTHYSDKLPDEVFSELAAERLAKVRSHGKWVLRWRQDRDRNEALDCMCMSLVLLRLHNPAWLQGEGTEDENMGSEGQEAPKPREEERPGANVSPHEQNRRNRQRKRQQRRGRRMGRR